jgi:hypothetical protein
MVFMIYLYIQNRNNFIISVCGLDKIFTEKNIQDHGHKTFEYECHTYTPKMSNQNAVSIGYDVLIGYFFCVVVQNL